MTVQSTYTEDLTVLTLGAVANHEASNVISRKVETPAGVSFGDAVMQGAADDGCIASEASGVFIGVVKRDQTVSPDNPNGLAQNDVASIVDQGVVVVEASVQVAAGESAYIVEASGAFTNTDNTGANPLVGRWVSSAAATGLAKLKLNLS